MSFVYVYLTLHHQPTRKMVKRWTVGLSHFLVVRRAPSCEAEGIPGKKFGYVKECNHFNRSV
jgi:hypothetical protein